MGQLQRMSDFYQTGRFEEILHIYDRMIPTDFRSAIYQNLFRVMCLLRTHDRAWSQEYFTALESGDWDKLGFHERKYILFYIYPFIAPDNAGEFKYRFDPAKVSSETKSFFPLIDGFHPPMPKKISVSISYNLESSTTSKLWSDSLGATSRGVWSYRTDFMRVSKRGDANS